ALQKFELDILTKPEVAEEVENVRAMNQFVKEKHHKMQNSMNLIEDFDDLENILNKEDIATDLEELRIRKLSTLHRDIAEFQAKLTESRVKDTLSNYHSNKVLVRKVSLWMVSASLAVLIIVSSILLLGNQKTDYAELYSEFYSPRSADVNRVAGVGEDPFLEALKVYNNADYSEAFKLLNRIPEEGVSNKLYLYKGITAMELGKFSLALELFHKLDNDANLNQEGMWYKSLCYLGMKDEKGTRQALNEIIRSDGYYKSKASELLKKI
ncbi:tol-pal system YbgF family protein, partial [Bacteroidota bacterium]